MEMDYRRRRRRRRWCLCIHTGCFAIIVKALSVRAVLMLFWIGSAIIKGTPVMSLVNFV